ncbi:hypothetical protein C9I57_05595 [Trinickia symbiotica]|uniref:Secreted protein n=1 Tax=Trinickia symbiotica TaxID=863227 RepID=A0A2T3XZX1_9BURK|nr:hypothetical protein [Trinickia symbiotica]PTB22073.1 hypothetical protein C9I57_05595 [Trinickia symbiotica]
MKRVRRPLSRISRASAFASLLALALAGALGPLAARGATNEAASAASQPSTEITPAEKLIFTTDHLHDVAPQTELDYAMEASGKDAGAADVVRVLVTSQGNTKGDAKVSDHSGAVPLPTSGLPCNPVIIYFLERDISEMQTLTGGQKRYFQQRLRLALAQGPTIASATSRIGGKPVAVRQIVVQPYLNDPNADRFPQYTGKRYTFELADALPGGVARIRTEVPGPNNDFVHPLSTETLTFQAAVRKLPESGKTAPEKSSGAPRASR